MGGVVYVNGGICSGLAKFRRIVEYAVCWRGGLAFARDVENRVRRRI